MTTEPPRTWPVPDTVNGSVPRPSSSTRTPSPRRASSTAAIGRVRACGSPSKLTAPVASAATGGTNRITVPARPQSTAPPCSCPGVTVQSVRRGVDAGSERAQRGRHQLGVARAQRPSYDGGAVGQGSEHQRPVGQRLRAGQVDTRVDRAARHRRRPQVEPSVWSCSRARLHAPEAIGRWTSRRAWPRAWPAGQVARLATSAGHAVPGAPGDAGAALGVDGRQHHATEHREVLEEVDLLVGLHRRVGLVPELVAGDGGGHEGGREQGAGQARGAAPGQRAGREDLGHRVDAHQRHGVVGDLHLRSDLLQGRPDPVHDGLGLDGECRCVLQGAHAADDERGREQGTGEQSGGGHGYMLTRSSIPQPDRWPWQRDSVTEVRLLPGEGSLQPDGGVTLKVRVGRDWLCTPNRNDRSPEAVQS